jgi:hypothetical protein
MIASRPVADVRLLIKAAKGEPEADPFVDVLFRRAGPRRGARVVSFMQAWGVVAEELERTPTIEEYAARFGVEVATAYRDQALFRDTFHEETPARILALLWDGAQDGRLRHLLSAPVLSALEAPEDASPVLARFAASVIDGLPSGAASHADGAIPSLAGSRGDRRTEVARAYGLADLAVFTWFAAVLRRFGEEGRLDGLRSLERIRTFDTGPAAYASGTLVGYGADLDGEAARACAGATQAAEAVAGLRVRTRGDDDMLLANAARAAAETLLAAFADGAIDDVVTATRESVEALLPTRAGATV